MAAAPIYLGDNRSLVTLRTGEVICVDTSSIDSIRYLTGVAEECSDLRLFRRFLTLRSTVVDIGANFGLFTAVAARVVGDAGRLFSIEANPRTFECLRRTVYANMADANPRIVLKNAAAFDRSGKVLLRFLADELGGATVVRPFHMSATERHCEIDAIVLDEYLPDDLRVDLVKIDAEGSEPAVLRGMERVIKRSPNVRIIIEYVEHMIAQNTPPESMLEHVRSLGLAICLIRSDAAIEIIGRSDAPPDNCYLLLTRTPERDRLPSQIEISPYELRYPEGYVIDGRNVLLQRGAAGLRFDSRSHAAVGTDVLFYGPYISVPAGGYEVAFHGRIEGSVAVRITRDFGAVIHECVVSDFEHPIAISLSDDIRNFEVVLLRMPDLELVEIESIALRPTMNS